MLNTLSIPDTASVPDGHVKSFDCKVPANVRRDHAISFASRQNGERKFSLMAIPAEPVAVAPVRGYF